MLKEQLLEKSEKVFFQVMIELEDCETTRDIPEDERILESQPIATWTRAENVAHKTIQSYHDRFPELNIIELPLDRTNNGYHLLLVDKDGILVAKVGVTITDYSLEKMH